jgi:hypothetical protein
MATEKKIPATSYRHALTEELLENYNRPVYAKRGIKSKNPLPKTWLSEHQFIPNI